MKTTRIYSIITIVWLVFCSVSCASDDDVAEIKTPPNPALTKENLSKADALFRQRTDVSKLREAISLLAQARNPDNRDFEVEWKFAEYNYFLGKQTDNDKESEKAFDAGAQAGRNASRLAPEKPDGYFWYGANLGEQARRSPLTKGLTSVGDIQGAMNKVIEIDPKYQGASAFDALAQIELATRLSGGGKTEKAIEYLEKGLQFERNNSNLRLHLAEAYLAANRDAEARKQLEYILTMKPDPNFLPEFKEDTEKAKKLLDTKF